MQSIIRRGFAVFPGLFAYTSKTGPRSVLTGSHLKMTTPFVRPEGVRRNWDLRQYVVTELESECHQGIEAIKQLANDVASTQTLSYTTVLKPVLECHRLYGERGTIGSVFSGSLVAESEELRSACVKCEGLMRSAFVDLEMRKDVYEKLVKYREEVSGSEHLSAELNKCLDKLILNSTRSGLQLSAEVQEKVKALKNEMSQLGLAFGKNLQEETTRLHFIESELKGMDHSFLSSLQKDAESGKYILTLKYPHYIPIMQKCVVPDTRRKMEIAFNSRCLKENSDILEKLVTLREEHAKVLGYPTHAAFMQEILMAKNPTTVENFLKNLVQKVTPRWVQEKEEMLQLKKNECEDLGLEFDGKINMWDFRRFLDLVIERKFSLDQELLKEYFPLPVVLEGMLKIYQGILGLTFTLLLNTEVWSDDVTTYEVKDTGSEEVLGYFYLDLHPRDGKHSHACCGPIQQGCLDDKGKRQKAVVVLICNFPRPTADRPSLLSHDDVVTMFHEFGHAMHGICSRAETPLFYGTRVQADFLEAPSQMLENWCYEKEALRLMSKHYKTGETLPDEIIDNLVKSKEASGGATTLRQIAFAMVDQRMHREGRYDTLSIYKDTLKELMGLESTPGTNMLASFGHLAGGYDARYYVYMWSLVFGEDMFETVFEKEGVLDSAAGMKYRKCILEPGGSLDGMDMLVNFLGREPSLDPFLRRKGLI